MSKSRAQKQKNPLTAEEELQELQGQWDLVQTRAKSEKKRKRPTDQGSETTQIYVRGKKVEEKNGKERKFFRLVLAAKIAAKKAVTALEGSDSRQSKRTNSETEKGQSSLPEGRHDLPPIGGPKVSPEIFKGKGKGGKGSKKQNHWVGHWMLMHHTPKLLLKSSSQANSPILWWHPDEQVLWDRAGATLETCNVRYISDNHTEILERHEADPANVWRTKKGVQVELGRA